MVRRGSEFDSPSGLVKKYMLLGGGTRTVDGLQVSLESALQAGNIRLIEGVLNAIAEEGWELFSLQPPYIFVKDVASEILKLGNMI